MSLSTSNLSRKDKTAELIKHHQQNFIMNGIEDPVYIPKCAYQPRGLDGLHMGFFESEIKKAVDVYTECVSINLEPEDPDRKLYKWRHNPHYQDEYPKTDPNSNGHVRYLIPVSELIIIEVPEEKEKSLFPNFDIPDDDPLRNVDVEGDEPLARMTMKDFSAIMWKKPVSSKKWLNDLIKNLNR